MPYLCALSVVIQRWICSRAPTKHWTPIRWMTRNITFFFGPRVNTQKLCDVSGIQIPPKDTWRAATLIAFEKVKLLTISKLTRYCWCFHPRFCCSCKVLHPLAQGSSSNDSSSKFIFPPYFVYMRILCINPAL